jgi:hypothetical protein
MEYLCLSARASEPASGGGPEGVSGAGDSAHPPFRISVESRRLRACDGRPEQEADQPGSPEDRGLLGSIPPLRDNPRLSLVVYVRRGARRRDPSGRAPDQPPGVGHRCRLLEEDRPHLPGEHTPNAPRRWRSPAHPPSRATRSAGRRGASRAPRSPGCSRSTEARRATLSGCTRAGVSATRRRTARPRPIALTAALPGPAAPPRRLAAQGERAARRRRALAVGRARAPLKGPRIGGAGGPHCKVGDRRAPPGNPAFFGGSGARTATAG